MGTTNFVDKTTVIQADWLNDVDRKIYEVKHFGALGNGSADDTSKIQDAINEVGLAGGGTIIFPPGNYIITSGLTIPYNNIFLQGYGFQWHTQVNAAASNHWTQNEGTIITWGGGVSASTMLKFVGATTGPTLHGGGLDGIILDAFGQCDYGLEILSMRGGRFGQIAVADAVVRNMHIGCHPTAGWSSLDTNGTQHCSFDKILSRVWKATALSAEGILIDGDDTADVSFCTFGEIFLIYADGHGLNLKSSDACDFQSVFGFRIPATTGNGIRLTGGVSTTDYPRKHHFNFIQPGAGSLVGIANTVPPDDIIIDCYSNGNGSPAPILDKGCAVSWQGDYGVTQRMNEGAIITTRYLRADADAINDNIAEESYRGFDSANNETEYAKTDTLIVDPTNGSEDGAYRIATMQAGTVTVLATFADGFKLFTGGNLKRLLTATASLDFPSITANGGTQSLTITVTGAQVFDSVSIGLPANGGNAGVIYSAYVSATDTVTVRATNTTTGAIDPANQTFRVTVFGF